MKHILILSILFFSTHLFAAEGDLASELGDEPVIAAVDDLGPEGAGFFAETDFGPDEGGFVESRILRNFVESRGLIECREKSGQLTLAGDVRARWICAGEKVDGDSVRGAKGDAAANLFKSEVNLFLDYATPQAWVTTKLRWTSIEGRDGGTISKVNVDRAFIGYDIYHCGKEDFYIEIGRSNLAYMFESQVEFSSEFSGIHLYYTKCFPVVGNFVIHGGPFVMDSLHNNYCWVVEAGIKKWYGTGFGAKYSIIDWRRRTATSYFGGNHKDIDPDELYENNPRYRFLVSQMLFVYEKPIDFCGCKTFFGYAAVLVNSAAKKHEITNDKKLNGAWYVGFTLGKLCKAYDWSIDINYQSVQLQAVPEFDLAGIGHGNAANAFFSDLLIAQSGPGNALGFTNYKGVQASLLYAMTNSLSLRMRFVTTTPLNRDIIEKQFRFKSSDMSVIYAF